MPQSDTAVVPFHEADLLTMRIDGTSYVVTRPVVEATDFGWSNPLKRIRRDPILGAAMVKTTTAFLKRQDQLLLPLALFHGWLFGVSVGAVKPELRSLLSSLIREGYQVLHDYWATGAAINPRLAPPAASSRTGQVAARREGPRLIALLEGETDLEVRRYYYDLLAQGCAAIGIPLPPLERIGRDAGDLFGQGR